MTHKYGIWELIKLLFNFFLGRRKEQEVNKQEEFNKISGEITDEYSKIDKKNEEKKNDNLKNRLNNMFSIILFGIILFGIIGCATSSSLPLTSSKVRWPMPPKPKTQHLDIDYINKPTTYADGYYFTAEQGVILVNNIDATKAYSEKLEILIKAMQYYYKFDLEVKD